MATYVGIARKEMSVFFDDKCQRYVHKEVEQRNGEIKRMQVKRPSHLYITAPWLVKKPDVLGKKTRQAIQDGILKEYSPEEAKQYVADQTLTRDSDLRKIFTEEDYNALFTSQQQPKTVSRTGKKKSKQKSSTQVKGTLQSHETSPQQKQEESASKGDAIATDTRDVQNNPIADA